MSDDMVARLKKRSAAAFTGYRRNARQSVSRNEPRQYGLFTRCTIHATRHRRYRRTMNFHAGYSSLLRELPSRRHGRRPAPASRTFTNRPRYRAVMLSTRVTSIIIGDSTLRDGRLNCEYDIIRAGGFGVVYRHFNTGAMFLLERLQAWLHAAAITR